MADDALLDAALASMPYGFTVWTEACTLALWNDTYLGMYHLPADRIRVGMTLRDMAEVSVGTGDHGELAVAAIHALYLERFQHPAGPKVFEHRSGARDIRTTNIRMPGFGWVVTHEDVTDEVARTRLAVAREAALARQNVRFAAAVDNMPHGLAMFDADRRLVICNTAFASLYGLPADLLEPGTTLDAIIRHRVDAGLVPDAAADESYIAGRLAIATERRRAVRFVEQERGRTIAVVHQPMPDGGWVSTHLDITEQQRREDLIESRTRELQTQNIRFEAAIDNMLHGLSMFDAKSRLIVCNRQYADMYGLPEALTRPGTSFWDILEDGAKRGMVSIADPVQHREDLGAVVEGGRTFKQNVKMVNGRVIAVLHQPMRGGGWLSTHEDVTEEHLSEENIRHLARHDALTDLPNRVLFGEEMAKLEARIRRKENIAVLCVDLDHFKTVNDSFGHAIGDSVLIGVARRLREAARESDVVARLGGDEFAILAGPLDDPRHAARIADRIVRSLGVPMTVEGKEIVIGGSVGIAMAPGDGGDAETLLRNADLALYRAKDEGRGAYHFFEPGMDEALRQRRALESGLATALERGEFRLAFQPVIRLADNRIGALEALLRWEHPTRGLVPPAEFIPVAEETGMIAAIGEWVIRQACTAAARWPGDVRLAVNLSAGQLRGRNFAAVVSRALAESGFAPDRLELEVTEPLLLGDAEAAAATLRELASLGLRLVLDDFGSGLGVLGHLRQFPFDKLKLDRALLLEARAGGRSAHLLDALVGLARSLAMETTAEGVETEAELELARRAGCDEAQGFLFSPPLPASGVEALLAALRHGAERRRSVAS